MKLVSLALLCAVVALTACSKKDEAQERREARIRLAEAIERAHALGAVDARLVDAKQRFVTDFVLPTLTMNALYQGRYPLVSALSRPLISEILVEIAQETGAEAVAHGCTGKGNDQVRFELTAMALIKPARGRDDVVVRAMSEEHGLLDLSRTDWRPAVGDRVRVIPNHVCIVVHLFDMVHGIRGETVESSWQVAARGRAAQVDVLG